MSLAPPIDQLGSAGPYLGPWFEPDVTLGAPRDPNGVEPYDLSIPLAIAPPAVGAPPTFFAPPAPGTASLFVSTAERPPGLARLRRPDGQPAFDDDRLVLLYTLLPPVEERLYRLLDQTIVPPADGSTPAPRTPQRARVRHLALQFATRRVDELFSLVLPGAPLPLQMPGIRNDCWPNPGPDQVKRLGELASYVGLTLGGDGMTLENSDSPMVDQHRPGYIQLLGQLPRIVDIVQSPVPLTDSFGQPVLDDQQQQATVAMRLYAFDDRGLPLDPGAVAAWWSQLAPTTGGPGHTDLWARGLTGADRPFGFADANDYRRTCGYVAARTVHFVDAHEQPLGGLLEQRLRDANPGLQALPDVGDWPLCDLSSATTPLTISTADPDAASGPRLPLPLPRLGVLPNGRHAAQLQLLGPADTGSPKWPTRDFIRLTMLEVEQHLLGQSRIAPPGPAPADPLLAARHAAETWRADNQARVSTRVRIATATPPVLLADADTAISEAIGVIAGSGQVDLVAGTLDPDWGSRALPPAGPAITPPATLWSAAAPTLAALAGGDPDPSPPSGPPRGQRLLLTLTGLPAGCWLRVWTTDFDLDRGSWSAGTGGAGLVGAAGTVHAVVELPGSFAPGTQAQLTAALTAPSGQTRHYGQVALPVPATVAGGGQGLAYGGGLVIVCEQGLANQALSPGQLRAGDTVVELGGLHPALVQPSTLPANLYLGAAAGKNGQVLANALGAADRVELTQPAFRRTPDGRYVVAGGAQHRSGRTPLQLFDDSQPLATQERLDQAVSDSSNRLAVIWTAPALGRVHDLGRHSHGHPFAPAAAECAGTGVRLDDLAADLVAEHTADRIDRVAAQLINTRRAAAPATAPTPAAGATIWAGVLRTVAAHVEGETAFKIALDVPYRYGVAVHGISTPGVTLPAYPFAPVDPADPLAVPRPYADSNGVYDAGCLKDWYDNAFTDTITLPILGAMPIFGTALPAAVGWSAAQLQAAERAMDRRSLAAGWGLREAVPALRAALARARDFIWLESPALDLEVLDPAGEQLVLLQTLIERLQAEPQLRLFVCVSMLPPVAGWPASMVGVWRDNLARALAALRAVDSRRVTLFAPSAGRGRPLRLSATTVIVDDAWALTGSTHLSRRGLSFDSSLATVVWDEQLLDGRPAEVLRFRRRLVSRRLSLAANRVPDDPAALADAIATYSRQFSGRLQALQFPAATTDPAKAQDRTLLDAANPDGGHHPGSDLLSFIMGLVTQFEAEGGLNGSP